MWRALGQRRDAVELLERCAGLFRELLAQASFGDTRANLDVVEAELRWARS